MHRTRYTGKFKTR